MLRTTKLTRNREALSKYYAEQENYYFAQAGGVESLSGDLEASGHVRVHGLLAEGLGFKSGQEVTQDELMNLLGGHDAAGRKVTREHKVFGYDLTFSAPKSVSIAGLLTLRDPKIIQAHDRAVLETMREFERRFAGTMPRAGTHEKTGNLVYVTVRDGFNRDHDPHVHTHVVVANMTAYNGKVLAVDGSLFLTRDFNHALGALYRAKLATNLKELGYSLSYTMKGELRMDAVSLELEKVFSKRRQEILAAKKDRGLLDMSAWEVTRKEKDPTIHKGEVLARWQAEAANCQERTPEKNREDAVMARQEWLSKAKHSLEAQHELAGLRQTNEAGRWLLAARRATEATANASAQAIITEYLKELGRAETWEGVTYQELELKLKAQVAAGTLLATDDGRYTTWEMTRADRECLVARKPAQELVMSREAASRELGDLQGLKEKTEMRALSDQQTKAALGILTAEQGTVVVQGDAGAGKTTMLRAVHKVAEWARWEVVGLSVQAIAAHKVETESGIKSQTIASFLASERQEAKVGSSSLARKPRLLIVDEASMIGSRQLAELQKHAQRHQDKLVLVGDRHQLQSLGAGKPFDRLVAAAEAAGSLLTLTENHRQKNPVLLKAVDLARQGRMRECIEALDMDNRVYEIADDKARRERIAALYDEKTLILTGSNESRERLNEIIRERLMKEGKLDRSTCREYRLIRVDKDGVEHEVKQELAVGERIVFLKNERRFYDVDNGNVGTVVGLKNDGVEVKLEDGRKRFFDLDSYRHFDYGYVLTTYKGQGQTYDKKISEADMNVPGLQDRRAVYVQETRARYESTIFTNDRYALYEQASQETVKRDTLELGIELKKAREMEAKLDAMAWDAALVKTVSAEAASREPEAVPEIRPPKREAGRLDNFRGTRETLLLVEKTARELEEAQRSQQAALRAEMAALKNVREAREAHNRTHDQWRQADWKYSEAKRETLDGKFWQKGHLRKAEEDARWKCQPLEVARNQSKATLDEAEKRHQEAQAQADAADKMKEQAQARHIEAQRRNDLQATWAALQRMGDMTEEQKTRIMQQLCFPESAELLSNSKNPEEAILASRATILCEDIDDIIKELPAEQRLRVEETLRLEKDRKAKENERSLGDDFGLSL